MTEDQFKAELHSMCDRSDYTQCYNYGKANGIADWKQYATDLANGFTRSEALDLNRPVKHKQQYSLVYVDLYESVLDPYYID